VQDLIRREPDGVLVAFRFQKLIDFWLGEGRITAEEASGCFLRESGEDRTPIELFIAAVEGWDTELQRVLAASADEK
jgi:hypothetical protein